MRRHRSQLKISLTVHLTRAKQVRSATQQPHQRSATKMLMRSATKMLIAAQRANPPTRRVRPHDERAKKFIGVESF